MVKNNPNEKLWQQYEDFAEMRGELVANVLSDFLCLSGTSILDYGCGTGGISRTFAKYAKKVTAFDVDAKRLKIFGEKLSRQNKDIEILADLSDVAPESFDVILLVDVIEHVHEPLAVLQQCHRLLKSGGLIYLTTPSRFSLLNIVCDPHFSLPFVCLFSRSNVRTIVGRFLRWQPLDRVDYPELLSLRSLAGLLQQSGLEWQFVNQPAAQFAVAQPHSLWNRPLHLRIVQHPIGNAILRFCAAHLSDRKAAFNRFINPTWFVIARKLS